MKNKKLWLKLGIFALSIGGIGLSFASAALFNVEIKGDGAVYAKKNIIPIHFADGGNDFGGFIYISNMDEISKGETEDPNDPVEDYEILGDRYYIGTGSTPTYECRAKVKGFYYNSERGERLWPLDENSAKIPEPNVPTTGGVYTLCRVTGYAQKACGCQGKVYDIDAKGCVCYNGKDEDGNCLPIECTEGDTECEEIKELSEKDPEVCMKEISEEYPEVEGFFGQVEHSFSGQTFGLVMGTTYDHKKIFEYNRVIDDPWYSIEEKNNLPAKLQSSFILWGKRIPIGFVYDYNGGLGFAGCEVTGRSTVPTLTKADTLDILVGSGNEGLLGDLFEGSGQSLVPKSDSPIASGLNCDKIGSMGDSLIHLLIEGLVGMNRNSDYSKVGAQSDTKMQYFSSSDINSATLLNYAKQRSEILCRGKWKNSIASLTSTSDAVACLDATNLGELKINDIITIGVDVTSWAKNNGKTLIIKNTRKETPVNVVIDPFTDSNDATYYDMFINGGNLIVNETDSTDKFVFNVGGFIAEGETSQTYEQKVGIGAINKGQVYTGDLAARASLIRGNFVVDGNIKGLPGADGILKNKYFIYGKFTTKDSFKDLEKTFIWNCNTDSGRASDKLPSGEYSYCPVSVEEEGYYNPYYNVSLVVIDQDYDSPLFM